LTGEIQQSLVVRNPLSEETSHLRTLLAPNLLQAVARNQAVGSKDVSIFEIGKVYKWSPDHEINEYRSASAVMVGSQWANAWNLNKEALVVDFYLIKGAIESLLGRLDIKNIAFTPVEHPLLHLTRAARVDVDGTEIGIIGEVAPKIVEKLDIRGRPCLFEINVDKLMPLVPLAIGYEQLSRFPAVYRHLAIVMARNVPYVDIKQSILTSGDAIVEGVELLDVYTGSQVGENEQSLTLSIVFRSNERTLTDEEVNGVMDKIKAQLSSAFGAAFRG
jgi:phenylalanyl-tRNA synthetase beta chain